MKLFKKKVNNPTLWIAPIVKAKMDLLVELCNKEVGWHGLVEKKGDNYIWYDILLYPQYVTGATTTTEEEEYSKWLDEQYNFDDGKSYAKLRLHGHSHVNMAVTPSGTDRTFRTDLLSNIGKNDFYIFLIINKRGDIEIEIYDTTNDVVFDENDINIIISLPSTEEYIRNWTNKVIKANVKERTYKCSTTSKATSFSTLTPSERAQCTSLDAVQSEQQFPRSWYDWEWDN